MWFAEERTWRNSRPSHGMSMPYVESEPYPGDPVYHPQDLLGEAAEDVLQPPQVLEEDADPPVGSKSPDLGECGFLEGPGPVGEELPNRREVPRVDGDPVRDLRRPVDAGEESDARTLSRWGSSGRRGSGRYMGHGPRGRGRWTPLSRRPPGYSRHVRMSMPRRPRPPSPGTQSPRGRRPSLLSSHTLEEAEK